MDNFYANQEEEESGEYQHYYGHENQQEEYDE